MQYLLIILTLISALFGVFKEVLPPIWRRLLVPILVVVLVLSSLSQIWLSWREEQTAKHRKESGILRSEHRSSAKYPVLQLCESGLKYTGDPTKPVFSFGGEGIFLRIEDGEAKLSMVVRDSNGIVMAVIRDNVWFVPKSPNVLDRNFDNNTLEVIGSHQEVILQVQILGEKARLAGMTHSREGGGAIGFGPLLSECDGLGEMLFKYPSTEFPGELIKPSA
jgi:hypothetical protein